MSDILSKISSYNIINYMIPGGIFTYFSSYFFEGLIKTDETFLLIFFMYFIGMCISRIGSIILEPIFTITNFVKNEDYSDYINAYEKDKKIAELLETASLYRTLSSGFAIFSIVLITKNFADGSSILNSLSDNNILVSIFLFTLFSFSYRKQNYYISKRIKHHSAQLDF
ncbi:hypothetical protein [Hoeflea alexandrii]|uniref:hypothetical protein n=1 Tax=Hoeflea alexandrii TaxID=288436 RepID=UPI0022B0416C|nr:hypothetical protein [Hoeflea alexandrii]MCZ4289942.1 hypothetical protein [Hoeflea alexandrii]